MIESKNIIVATDGTLNSPALHDGRLLELIAYPDQHLLLLTTDVRERFHCIVLKCVERSRADDFREGNIILDITVHSGQNVRLEDVAYAFGVKKDDPSLFRIRNRIAADKLTVVCVNPSYGCSFVAVCTDIDIVTDWACEFALLEQVSAR